MIFSLFRSPKSNWVNRLNKLLDMQLKIARDGLSENEKLILDDLNGPSWSPEKKIKKINLLQKMLK